MPARAFRILCSAAALASSALSQLRRDMMLQRFRSHMSDFANGQFEQPHTNDEIGLTVYISKQDSMCGGSPQPFYHIDFVVPNARPIDVFNILSDIVEQPQWLCDGCYTSLLKNDVQQKVQGYTAAFPTGPMPMRQFYQWQAYDVDFNADEYMIGVYGASDTEELRQMEAPKAGAVVGTMCTSFSYITRGIAGTHVVQMTHFNANVPQLPFGLTSPRNMYGLVWPLLTNRVPKIIKRAQQQRMLNWSPQHCLVPPAYLDPPVTTVAPLLANITTITTPAARMAEAMYGLSTPTPAPTDYILAKLQFIPRKSAVHGGGASGTSSSIYPDDYVVIPVAQALCVAVFLLVCCSAVVCGFLCFCSGSKRSLKQRVGGEWRRVEDPYGSEDEDGVSSGVRRKFLETSTVTRASSSADSARDFCLCHAP